MDHNEIKKDCERKAAQLWCLPQHSHKEMDVSFAESIAELLFSEHLIVQKGVAVLEKQYDLAQSHNVNEYLCSADRGKYLHGECIVCTVEKRTKKQTDRLQEQLTNMGNLYTERHKYSQSLESQIDELKKQVEAGKKAGEALLKVKELVRARGDGFDTHEIIDDALTQCREAGLI